MTKVIIEPKQFIEMLPRTNYAKWFALVNILLPTYDIDTPKRICAFLANCAHESNNFNTLEENLSYSAKRLREVWPRRFPTDAIAAQYSRNPTKIANKVYANRLGNSDEASGDGWKYRGRGLIQLTGKANYTECSKALFKNTSYVDNPDLLLQPEHALRSACWFWNNKSLSIFADADGLEQITMGINGAMLGHSERVANYNRMMKVLNNNVAKPEDL
jgi:putative chitinase